MLKEDVLRLLREDVAFREAVRRQILTDDLVALPEKAERLRAEMHEQFGKAWSALGALTERIEALTTRVGSLAEQVTALTARVDALAEAQQRTEARLEALAARVDALAEAQRRTEARLEALTARVDALAEAQQRTEARLEALTARVDALAEAQRRTEARLEALTARVESLAEAQRCTEARLEALTARVESLAEAQQRTEARLEALTARVDAITETIGRMEERWGLAHEQIAQDLVPEILRRKGWKVLKAAPLVFNGEMDLVVAVEADGWVFTLATEVKGRVWSRTPMEQVLAKARQPAFVAAARREGFPEPIVPAVFGLVIYSGAEEAARQAGVGLLSPHGELVPPSLRR